MSDPIKFPIFRDKEGNRFIFPDLWHGGDNGRAYRWGFCREICCALGVTEEKEPFSVQVDAEGFINFSRVEASAGSRRFMHGSETVWLISGPRFDAVMKEPADV